MLYWSVVSQDIWLGRDPTCAQMWLAAINLPFIMAR